MENIRDNDKEIWNYYFSLVHKLGENEREIQNSPSGYISKKHIKGRVYYYYQKRDGDTVISCYLKPDEVNDLAERIQRKKLAAKENKELLKKIKMVERCLPPVRPLHVAGNDVTFKLNGGHIYMTYLGETVMFGLAIERIFGFLYDGAELFANRVSREKTLTTERS